MISARLILQTVILSPDSDNNDFADGGKGKDGVMTKRVTWVGPHL